MRLLNTDTIKLEDFPDEKAVPYAILSHTWGAEEVTFQDLSEPKSKNMAGYAKITGCCDQARLDGFNYVWIDACCIDKKSSSELSEAINSMFLWYRSAQVCYAYLADVSSGGDHQSENSEFAKSRWFTRGWTLQELLAPSKLVFYGKDWMEIGTKSSLQAMISHVTGIIRSVLLDKQLDYLSRGNAISIATKMSWASGRKTTRVEDMAYCLMGIFGVNMPTLYGEGSNAFLRLQRKIIKMSNDHSIFAWRENKYSGYTGRERGLLARSPAEFIDSDMISDDSHFNTPHSSYSMTNIGLAIQLRLKRWDGPDRDTDRLIETYIALLRCGTIRKEQVGIYLQPIYRHGTIAYYVRARPGEIFTTKARFGRWGEFDSEFQPRSIHVQEQVRYPLFWRPVFPARF